MAVRFDDQFPIHRKVGTLSDAAFRLHVEAICWSARNLTDGAIQTDELLALTRTPRPHRYAAELVRRGVWLETADGWRIHDYLDWQPSRSKVLQIRQERRKNGQVGGALSSLLPRHPFVNDGADWCTRCGLPRINKIHSIPR